MVTLTIREPRLNIFRWICSTSTNSTYNLEQCVALDELNGILKALQTPGLFRVRSSLFVTSSLRAKLPAESSTILVATYQPLMLTPAVRQDGACGLKVNF